MNFSNQDLIILQGATFNPVFFWTLKDADSIEYCCCQDEDKGTPVDLTGCTARLQARDSYASPTVLLDLSTEDGGIILGGDTGIIKLIISAEKTSLINWSRAVYDLEIKHSNGDVTRLMGGVISVSMGITRE